MTPTFPDAMTEQELDVYRDAAKEGLRTRMAAVRRSLSVEARSERAAKACAQLIELPEFQRAELVLAYAPLRFELDPQLAVDAARARGKRIALPRVVQGTAALTLHVFEAGDELEESGFAVREPLERAPRIHASEVDLVLVPGLAFDTRGFRLGYGKGFYDRLLPTLSRAHRVGLAFELSLLPEVPSTRHDVPVHAVLTERRNLRAEPSR